MEKNRILYSNLLKNIKNDVIHSLLQLFIAFSLSPKSLKLYTIQNLKLFPLLIVQIYYLLNEALRFFVFPRLI